MELDISLLATIAGAVAGVVIMIVVVKKFLYTQEDRKPKFSYEKFKENKMWKIRIHHPDKIIHKFSIIIDGEPLSLADAKQKTQLTLRIDECQNFDVPDKVNDNSQVIIKYDDYYIPIKFKDIPLNPHS